MSKAGAAKLITAILLTILTNAADGAAQTQVVQTPSTDQTRPRTVAQQSANQIVGATDQKPVDSKPVITLPESEPVRPQPQIATAAFENAVVPHAPIIVKRSTNSIMIPVDATGSAPNPGAESKYEQRPIVSSNVNVGSDFGYRRDPFTRRAKFHSGVDIKARWGDPIGASQAGIVQFAGWYHGYGNMVVIAHGGGITTHYAHLSSFDVELGTRVERGAIIGRAGSTGRATSPHLHYEVRLDGNPLNPFQPLALEASSDYFKQARPAVDAGRPDSTLLTAPQR